MTELLEYWDLVLLVVGFFVIIHLLTEHMMGVADGDGRQVQLEGQGRESEAAHEAEAARTPVAQTVQEWIIEQESREIEARLAAVPQAWTDVSGTLRSSAVVRFTEDPDILLIADYSTGRLIIKSRERQCTL